DGRDEEEEDHHDAVHREHLVVGVRGHQVAGRRGKFEPDEAGEDATETEERRDGEQVEQRDPLVVLRQEPRPDSVGRAEIVELWIRWRCHGSGVAVFRMDFTYSSRAITPSSLTSPWNVGI